MDTRAPSPVVAETKDTHARHETEPPAPAFSSLFFKLAGTTFVLGLAPLLVVAFFVPSGYETIAGKLVAAIPNFSLNPEFASLRESMQTFYLQTRLTIGILIAFIVVGGLIASYLLARPLRLLTRFVKRINWDDPATLVMPQSYDEVGELASELRKGIESFKRIHERDREISQSKSDFLKIAAHQLRTPLTEIKWSLGAMRERALSDEESRRYSAQASASVDQMIDLVGDLLDVVRVEENRFGYSFKKLDLVPLLAKVAHVFETAAVAHGIRFTLAPLPDPLPFPVMDVDAISIVLNNLLSNALNYTPRGGAITITAALDVAHDRVEISVHDTGIGIPDKDKSHIFTQFFRAPNAANMQPNGSGVGLFIAQKLVQRHGGVLRFESTEGQGSTFAFTLPLLEKNIPKREEQNFTQFFDQLGPGSPEVRPAHVS